MQRRSIVTLIGATTVLGGLALYWPKRWNHIVIHHTAGSYATLEFLRQVRRERQPSTLIDEAPYHYIIGNGNGIGMGEVVETQRAATDLWGAHVAKASRNFLAIGVVLVGNFETTQVPEQQLEAAVTLTRSLMGRYRIPPRRVTLHGKTPGESSKCPGKNFPHEDFLQAIS